MIGVADQAEDLIRDGRFDEACDLLAQFSRRGEAESREIKEAVKLLASAGCIEEARDIYASYGARAEAAPSPDVDALELESLSAGRKELAKGIAEKRALRYPRLSVSKRGWFSRYLPFDPRVVREVTVSPEGLSVRRLFRTRHYPWANLRCARIRKKYGVTAYGYSRIEYVRRVLELEFEAGRVALDVSSSLPEFNRPDLLETAVRHYATVDAVKDTELPSPSQLQRWARELVVLLILLAGTLIWLISQR